MTRVLLIDIVGSARAPIEQALRGAGWEVVAAEKPSSAALANVDAVVLAADAASLNVALGELMDAREDSGLPVVLVADLDRSGWDRTFSAAGALGVDALLDLPVDGEALVARLNGIFSARETARERLPVGEMSAILDRAIANEEAAAGFYRQAAKRVTDRRVREALEGLGQDEHEHKRLLEEFRRGRRPLPEGSTAGGHLVEKFGTPDFSQEMSPADAFLLAARKEQLAVEFYENWGRLYPEGPERDLLFRLAEIERRHKAKVEAMFTNAAFPEVW
jgi:rubrerythrin